MLLLHTKTGAFVEGKSCASNGRRPMHRFKQNLCLFSPKLLENRFTKVITFEGDILFGGKSHKFVMEI
jgi:hypothetical protein